MGAGSDTLDPIRRIGNDTALDPLRIPPTPASAMANLTDIAPGSDIRIRVTREPTNAAARKTIVRVLSKDAGAVSENERLRKARVKHLRHAARGGRQWAIRVPKQHPVAATTGSEGTVRASVDVLRDLGSVERFVEVEAV